MVHENCWHLFGAWARSNFELEPFLAMTLPLLFSPLPSFFGEYGSWFKTGFVASLAPHSNCSIQKPAAWKSQLLCPAAILVMRDEPDEQRISSPVGMNPLFILFTEAPGLQECNPIAREKSCWQPNSWFVWQPSFPDADGGEHKLLATRERAWSSVLPPQNGHQFCLLRRASMPQEWKANNAQKPWIITHSLSSSHFLGLELREFTTTISGLKGFPLATDGFAILRWVVQPQLHWLLKASWKWTTPAILDGFLAGKFMCHWKIRICIHQNHQTKKIPERSAF